MGGGDEYWAKHREVLEPISATMGSSDVEVDKEALQKSYDEHLTRLGLLRPRYGIDSRTKQPEFDSRGAQKVRGYELTRLGLLFLRHIGIAVDAE